MKLVLATLATLVAVEAHAQASFNPTRMTCAQTRAAIKSAGVAVLRWNAPGSGVPRYGRYVRNSSQCSLNQMAVASPVPTRDRKSCGVYICGARGDDND